MSNTNRTSLTHENELLICAAQLSDAAEIIDYLNRVGGETDFLTFGLNEFPLSAAEEEKAIVTCLKEGCSLMLVGKINNTIVSHLYLDGTPRPRLAHLAEISVTVLQKYWGNGIGSQMIKAAISWAKENQITKLILYARTDNHAAIHLYKKQGFVMEGLITRAVKIGEIYYDNYVMGRVLS